MAYAVIRTLGWQDRGPSRVRATRLSLLILLAKYGPVRYRSSP
jgi:hypothetical protein